MAQNMNTDSNHNRAVGQPPPKKKWICDICSHQNPRRKPEYPDQEIVQFCRNCDLMEKTKIERFMQEKQRLLAIADQEKQDEHDTLISDEELEDEEEEIDDHQSTMVENYQYMRNYKTRILAQMQNQFLYIFNELEHNIFRKTIGKLKQLKDSKDKNQFKMEVIQPFYKLFCSNNRYTFIDKLSVCIPSQFFRYYCNMMQYYTIIQDVKDISLPIEVETLCLLYYHSKHDWDTSTDLQSDTLSIDGDFAFVNRNNTKSDAEFGIAWVQRIVSKGYHKWTFRIKENNAYNRFDLGIGITDNKDDIDPNGCLFNAYSLFGCRFSWNDHKYAFKQDDIVSIILDFDDRKLKFIVNEYLDACTDITEGSYRAAVCMHKDKNCIELF